MGAEREGMWDRRACSKPLGFSLCATGGKVGIEVDEWEGEECLEGHVKSLLGVFWYMTVKLSKWQRWV
jgi:hypothetical protein